MLKKEKNFLPKYQLKVIYIQKKMFIKKQYVIDVQTDQLAD